MCGDNANTYVTFPVVVPDTWQQPTWRMRSFFSGLKGNPSSWQEGIAIWWLMALVKGVWGYLLIAGWTIMQSTELSTELQPASLPPHFQKLSSGAWDCNTHIQGRIFTQCWYSLKYLLVDFISSQVQNNDFPSPLYFATVVVCSPLRVWFFVYVGVTLNFPLIPKLCFLFQFLDTSFYFGNTSILLPSNFYSSHRHTKTPFPFICETDLSSNEFVPLCHNPSEVSFEKTYSTWHLLCS